MLLQPPPVREIARRWRHALPSKLPGTDIDEFIVMPNHIHGIVVIAGADQVGTVRRVCTPNNTSLHRMVQWFKTMTTNEYLRGVRQLCWEPFIGRLWQ
jgi:REP element-mobilizing transposase RayT